MTVEGARKWLVVSSLSVTGLIFVFFLFAPAIGFPVIFSQSLGILEVVLPVFLGYLVSAATFVFRSNTVPDELVFRRDASSLVGLLIRGPLVVFAAALVALIAAFGVTNSPSASPGSGMSVDQLTAGISVILGLLAVTTNVAVSYLFGGGGNVEDQTPRRSAGDAALLAPEPRREDRITTKHSGSTEKSAGK